MRKEKDSMGEMEVSDDALYGASTQRAVLNFPVSDLRFSKRFITALGIIKKAAALTNAELGILDKEKADAICQAAQEVIDGTLYEQFVLDIFQTGSGTSTNMNANEVIANRSIELLGGKRGDKQLLHPNDHVNMSQSSNDVIPTAIHVSAGQALEEDLLPALDKLAKALEAKSSEFSDIVKAGRTHLQDATPITLGQEFSGYAAQIRGGISRVKRAQTSLHELALGGTAVGTGVNTPPAFAQKAIAQISTLTGVPFVEASNHFEAQAARDAVVELSGQLKTIACSLLKIANDMRWLAAGPRCSLGEICLPEIQPGSSIMPAKVNPVICESVMMVAAQVMGNDTCITVGGQHGNLELNVMMPVMAYNILESIELLANVSSNFVDKCISGITANAETCRAYAENSLATCTSLAPKIGYDQAAALAKSAYKEKKTVREMAQQMQVLPADELEDALDLMKMTKPGL
ncbi:class II fumarate hydratase [Oligoflexia bacterium]|nr:class II fumarate hydratase [Oligoflexia bacterium]